MILKRKKLVSLLLTRCLLLPVPLIHTKNREPVEVRTQEELRKALELNDDIILTDDIALTGKWAQVSIYSGELNGNGHTISGLNVNSNSFYCGLVGLLFSGGCIKNLSIFGTVISSYPYSTACTGGFVGVNEGKIENCNFYGSVIQSQGDNQSVGGIAGRNEKRGIITGCRNYGDISGISSGGIYDAVYAGGITGSNHGSITSCANHGMISGVAANSHTYVGILWGSTEWKSNGGYVGGIAGDTRRSDSTNHTNINNGTVVGADSSNQVKLVSVTAPADVTFQPPSTMKELRAKLSSSIAANSGNDGAAVVQWRGIRMYITPMKSVSP